MFTQKETQISDCDQNGKLTQSATETEARNFADTSKIESTALVTASGLRVSL